MPIPEIAAALASATHAANILRGLHKLARDGEINVAIIDLQQTILDLQSKIFDIQSKHEELLAEKERVARELADVQNWRATAERYELHELADGIFVYSLIHEEGATDPEHYICPHCFENRKRSIMNRPGAGYTNFVCHVCKFEARPVASAAAEVVRMRRSSRLEGL